MRRSRPSRPPLPRPSRPPRRRSPDPAGERVLDWPEIAGDPRFFQRAGPHTLAAIADAAEAEAPPRRLRLSGIAPLHAAGPADVSFLDNRKYIAALEASQAGAVIVHPDMAARVPAT